MTFPFQKGVLAAALLAAAQQAFAQPANSPADPPAQGTTTGSEQTLPAVKATAPALVESATGPAPGYVAERSATGTKTDALLIETPQSVSVVTRDQMDAQQVQNASEAVRYSAGAASESFGADPRADWIKLRGFYVPDFLDGLPMPRGTYAWARTDPYQLERFELLRGPASTLYGQSPPGGLVNMVSKRPSSERLREVQLQLGDPKRLQGALDLAGPIGSGERFSYRMVAAARAADTHVDHVDDDHLLLAPSLTWRIGNATSLTLLAHYIRNDSKSLQFLPSQGTLTANPNGRIPRDTFLGNRDWDDFDLEQSGLGYAFEHRFGSGLTFRQNLRRSEVEYDLQVVRGFGFAGSERRLVSTRPVLIQDRVRTLGVDNQLEYKGVTGRIAHTVLAGVDYQKQRTDYNFGTGALRTIDIYQPADTPIGPISNTASTDQEQRQIGFYLQDQARIDRLTLLLSARHDRLQGDSLNRRTGLNTRLDTDETTGRIGAIYDIGRGLAPYVSYATSFQPNLGVDYTGRALDPTTGKQLEAGLKYQPPGWGRSMASLAVYDLKQNDIVASNPALGGSQQIGQAKVRGAELEMKAQVSPALAVLGALTYLDASVTRSVNEAAIGKDLPLTPGRSASIWLDYTFGSDTLPGASAAVGVRHIGRSYADDANSLAVPSATLLDVALRYRLGRLSPSLSGTTLALNIVNLADREYVSGCNDANTCYWGAGRTARLTVTHRF